MNAVPTVSVIIPAYNYGHFIGPALESVFAQTYQNFEVIVVDDGSTDDTRTRVDFFGRRVRYIHQTNAGLSAARNAGIRASRGTLIALLDADDVWLPLKLERQIAVLEGVPQVGVAYSWWGYIDEVGATLPQTARPAYHGQVFEELLRGLFFANPSTWLIRRTCLDRVGLFDPGLERAEDWDLLLRMAGAGYAFAYAPEILMHYRVHADQLSNDIVKRTEFSYRIFDKALAHLTPDAWNSRHREAAYRDFLVMLLTMQIALAAACWRRGQTDRWRQILLDPAVEGAPAWESPDTFLRLAYLLLADGWRTPAVLCERSYEVIAGLHDALSVLAEGPSYTTCRTAAGHVAIAQIYGASGACGAARRALLRAAAVWPGVLSKRKFTGTLLRSVTPSGVLGWVRSLRDRTNYVFHAVRDAH